MDSFFDGDADIEMAELESSARYIQRCKHRDTTTAEYLRAHSYEYADLPAFCDGQRRCDECGVWIAADGQVI